MFTITIQKPTAEEAIAELIKAAGFYKAHPEIASEAPPKPTRSKKDATASTTSAATSPSDPAGPSSSGSAASAASSTTASAPSESPTPSSGAAAASPSEEKVVTAADVRAFLSPYLTDPKTQVEVTTLIAEVGGAAKLSMVPPQNLRKLLAAAKEKFGG